MRNHCIGRSVGDGERQSSSNNSGSATLLWRRATWVEQDTLLGYRGHLHAIFVEDLKLHGAVVFRVGLQDRENVELELNGELGDYNLAA